MSDPVHVFLYCVSYMSDPVHVIFYCVSYMSYEQGQTCNLHNKR
jgi:hypothetical protein